MEKVYRILYCSRNCMDTTAEQQLAEVRKILVSSRNNNAARGVTGALLFSPSVFAQVLEGPLEEVENTFERIQRDMRHEDVAVLESGYVSEREFPAWSMAFAGGAPHEEVNFQEFTLEHIAINRSVVAEQVSSLLHSLVVQ